MGDPIDPTPGPIMVMDDERQGRRSTHGSSADSYEKRDRAEVMLALRPLTDEEKRISVPMVGALQARNMEDAFQALVAAVLTEDDYALYVVKHQKEVNGRIVDYERIEKRKRKSAWRKLARYFNLDVEILREVIGHQHVEASCARILMAKHGAPLGPDEDCGCSTIYARYHIKVTAPNGRIGFGVGIASRSERSFKAQDHSLPATAFTRGVSRAVSDMIGAGESEADDPAETRDSAKGEASVRPAEGEVERLEAAIILTGEPIGDGRQADYEAAWKASSEDQKRRAVRFLQARGYQTGQFVTHGAYDYDTVLEMLGAALPEIAP